MKSQVRLTMNPSSEFRPDNTIAGIAIAEYLQAIDDGKPLDPESWLAKYPQQAGLLRDFLRSDKDLATILLARRSPIGSQDINAVPALADSTDRSAVSTPMMKTGATFSGELESGAPFGYYTLGLLLGNGGSGTVYQATDSRLNREVAIKLLRSGAAANQQERKRLRREAEAIAQLEHPFIVPIYEVGEIQGREFIAMKLLQPLTQQRSSSIEAASRLLPICEAVHFAHQRGILHRDLKPANILLDQNQVPHVADFGLAKRFDLSEESTVQELMVGTPAYIAPEQIAGDSTILADVYGLGGILYWMLTGKPPHAAKSIPELLASFDRLQPPTPRSLCSTIDRDLEVICLKCLQIDPNSRYTSARALHDDLKAWLAGEPIQARSTSLSQRVTLWCRRKPALASLSVALLLTLAISSSVVLLNYSALQTSNQQLSTTNDALHEAILKEQAALRAADDNLRTATAAVEKYLTRVSESKLLNTEKMQPLRRELLGDALEYYQQFLEGRSDDPRLQFDTATALCNLGRLQAKIGELQEASTQFDRAWELLQPLLGVDSVSNELILLGADTLREQALLKKRQSQLAESIATCEQALTLLQPIADQGRLPQQLFLEITGEIAKTARQMGNLQLANERYEAAIQGFEKLVQSDPQDVRAFNGLVTNLGNLSNLYMQQRKTDPAFELLDQLIERLEQFLLDRTDSGFERLLANSLNSRAVFCFMTQRAKESVPYAQRAAELSEQILKRDPYPIESREIAGQCLLTLETAYRMVNQHEVANDVSNRAIEVYQALQQELPQVRDYKLRLAALILNRANSRDDSFDTEKEIDFRDVIRVTEDLLAANPQDTTPRNTLNIARGELARLLTRQSRFIDALELWPVVDLSPAVPYANLFRAAHALTLAKAGEFDQALETLQPLQPFTEQPDSERWICLQTLVCCAANKSDDGQQATDEAREQWLQAAIQCLQVFSPEKLSAAPEFVSEIRLSSDFESIRTHPEYQRLQTRFQCLVND